MRGENEETKFPPIDERIYYQEDRQPPPTSGSKEETVFLLGIDLDVYLSSSIEGPKSVSLTSVLGAWLSFLHCPQWADHML